MILDKRIVAALDKAGHPGTSDAESATTIKHAYRLLKGETFTQKMDEAANGRGRASLPSSERERMEGRIGRLEAEVAYLRDQSGGLGALRHTVTVEQLANKANAPIDTVKGWIRRGVAPAPDKQGKIDLRLCEYALDEYAKNGRVDARWDGSTWLRPEAAWKARYDELHTFHGKNVVELSALRQAMWKVVNLAKEALRT